MSLINDIVALTQFTDNGNTRVWTLEGHTASMPMTLTQKRVSKEKEGELLRDSLVLRCASKGPDGSKQLAATRISVEVTRPVGGLYDAVSAEVDGSAALGDADDILVTMFKALVQQPQFLAMISEQKFIDQD